MGNPWTAGPWFLNVKQLNIFYREQGTSGKTALLAKAYAPNGDENAARANARLIAAAPEMAEVLECLARMAEHFPAERIYGTRVRSGAIYTVEDVEHGEASITVEDLHRARTLLSRIRGETP